MCTKVLEQLHSCSHHQLGQHGLAKIFCVILHLYTVWHLSHVTSLLARTPLLIIISAFSCSLRSSESSDSVRVSGHSGAGDWSCSLPILQTQEKEDTRLVFTWEFTKQKDLWNLWESSNVWLCHFSVPVFLYFFQFVISHSTSWSWSSAHFFLYSSETVTEENFPLDLVLFFKWRLWSAATSSFAQHQ